MRGIDGRMDKWPPVVINSLKFVGVLVGVALAFYLAARLMALLVPFVVAMIVAAMVERPVKFMCHRLKMNRTVAAFTAVLLVVAVLAGAMLLIAMRVVGEVRDFAMQLPQMYEGGVMKLQQLLVELDQKYEFVTPDLIQSVTDSLSGMQGQLINQASAISRGVWNTAISMPRVIVSLIVMLLATFFVVRDRVRMGRYVDYQLPSNWLRRMNAMKDDLFSALFGYVRALLILMAVTFVELLVGLSIVGVKYALLIALVIALLDALPVLGTGTLVMPWAIYNLIVGDYRIGIGLILVFCVVWVVRQILEPYVVGNQIGMHPLLTLMAMYLGMQFMGVPGMILGPIVAIIARNVVRVYMRGRPLRQVLFEGASESAEDRAKSYLPASDRPSWRERLVEKLRHR